ncbi:RNA polymerase sigma factor [Pedobacter faecalis]|uniref:RNA polymerase sigma factor n=1 Tax=Pedobacter faecalis TaxID=3041495 RepID=UPI00254DFDAD|nr:RNA polymerase sigma-70 factor [Pedobacter sp. ELA7]
MEDYSAYSDLELIRELSLDNTTALTEIHSRYYAALYIHAYKRFPHREEILDLLQEIFVALWNNRETLSISVNLQVYLYGAVRKSLLKLYRHNKVRTDYINSLQVFIDQGANTTYEKIREKELLLLIEAEIAALPPQMRIIFELSRTDELSHKEIAERLNISPQTVRTQVRNALRILRSKLGANIFFLL